jgi:crotonobetainyl-CoA:carnitine CoA-transferase CaiB-like acyl-CoA transferase
LKRGLEDVKIVEYCDFVAAPFCSKLMADLGAEVIKVERLVTGDSSRAFGPFPQDGPGPERSGLFSYLNANKYGVTLNLETPTGRDIFQRLVAGADILIEDNSPEKASKLGMAYSDLKAANSSLVVTSITPFGQTGFYKEYKGSDLILWHMCSAGLITPRNVGTAEREPLRILHLADHVAGATAAVAALGALHVQRHRGIGQHVDVSMLEALLWMAGWVVTSWPYEHDNPTRASKAAIAPYHFIECRDGWLFSSCPNEYQWDRFVDMMGNPDWAGEELFKDAIARSVNWDSLGPLIMSWSTQYTKQEIFEMGKSKGIPIAPLNTITEVMGKEQLTGRGFFVDVEQPGIGTLTVPGAPFKLSSMPWGIRRPAPALGEHNWDIYCDRLGFSREELVKLYEAGII